MSLPLLIHAGRSRTTLTPPTLPSTNAASLVSLISSSLATSLVPQDGSYMCPSVHEAAQLATAGQLHHKILESLPLRRKCRAELILQPLWRILREHCFKSETASSIIPEDHPRILSQHGIRERIRQGYFFCRQREKNGNHRGPRSSKGQIDTLFRDESVSRRLRPCTRLENRRTTASGGPRFGDGAAGEQTNLFLRPFQGSGSNILGCGGAHEALLATFD